MENLSHSLPKKNYRSNGFAGKTVYDDVFGGPPKFGVPTLSPRVEDYSEIFEGFHASRGSSIPILDLPAVDEEDADLFFDVRSSEFDYSEVFGGFKGLDFAVSYEELFKQSTLGDDSSDEAWTPAQSESLSDESDPSACSEKNQSLSYGDLHHSSDAPKQFNTSYHKAKPKGKKDMLSGVTHVTQLDALPGYFIVNETLRAQKIEDENSHLHINQNTDFGGGVTEGKQLRKTVSQPPNSDFGVQEYESEPNPLSGHDKASSPQKAFISVSDINLRTQPSHLPPPSRPPPAFTDRKGNSSRLNSKLKASKSYAFERVESDSSPPYFDVEIDASSSAAASAAAMKNAVEKAQAQLRSAKELMERKKEGLQSRTKLHLENDLEHSGEKTNKFDRFNSCKGERVQSACEREGNEMRTYAAGQRKNVRNTTHVASGVIDGEGHIDIAGKSALSDQGKEHTSSQASHKTEGTVAWREETQFCEEVKPTQVKDKKTLEQHSKSHDCGPKEKSTGGALDQQEYNKRTKAARVDHEWEENREQFEGLKGVGEQIENKGRRIAAKGSTMQEEYHEKANLAQNVSEWQEEEKKTRVSPELGETEKRLNELDIREDCKILTEDQLESNEVISKQKLKGVHERVKRIKKAHERKGRGREIKETFDSEEYERELKEDVEQVGNGRKLKKALELGAKEEREKEVCGREEIEKKPEEAYEIGQKREKWEETLGASGIAKRSKEFIEQEESGNRLQVDLKPQENKKEKYWACEEERNEKNTKVALEQEKNAKKQEKAYEVEESEKILINDCERDETEKRLKEAWKQEENNKRPREAHESDESEKGAEVLFKEEGTEDRSKETNERVDCYNRIKDDHNCDGFSGLNSAHEQIKREENDRNLNQGIYASVEGQKASDGACNLGDTDSPQAIRVAGHDKIHGNLETQNTFLCEENGRLRTEPKNCEREMEAIEGKIELIEGRFDSYGMDQSDLQHEKTNNKMKDTKESLCLHDSVAKSKKDDDDIGGIHIDKSKGVSEMASDTENAYIITHKHREGRKNINGVQIAFDQGENRDKFASSHVVREWVQHGRKAGDVLLAQNFDSQSPERKETNFNEKLTLEEREKEERLKRERDLEDDRLRKIEEEKEREREREKDRMAVDTATREARERALTEARDRAERAAVERATAEVRQRALAEARERLEKASAADARERLTAEKILTDTRLKAERATMERATSEARERATMERAASEARERAFEKAMVEKASFAAHERMERSVSDNFSSYSRNGGLRQSSSSTDLQYGVGSSRDLKYSYSSVGGLEGESAQRCKARLERHQRTAERAAKALAEKNMRDLLVHKEQAERNRLAESLDADVKRWSSGKEGNLRALLSTLQYILGHDSGWKPIPLTDVITAVAVKKAYRKATLFVHPDKLQQRGASIQQKYICEKVFDLLKEAWNKFNSEER